jgi:hypothetical protein
VLVAITTNEDLARLHPAVVRPGRCLARVEVPALPFGEAAAWLGTSAGVPADGATLAELYALRDGHGPARDTEPVPQGLYLKRAMEPRTGVLDCARPRGRSFVQANAGG